MAGKALKGLTIQIGADTTQLNDALKDVDKRSSSLSKELGQINKLLKFNPEDTQLLAQKQKVLADAIGNTEKRLATLKEAEKQAQEQFERGEITEEQYRALQREVIATEQKLGKLRKEAGDTSDALDRLGKEADDAGDDIEETGDKADDAETDVDDLCSSLADTAKNGFTALAAAATAAIGAIVATAEASREYRREMGKLTTAFQETNFSAETAYETYSALQGVIGETDQAVEAANHLAALCTTEGELANWTDILTGVYAKFGVSLQPEALTEAANETARCGTVTGAFADSLNWAAAEGETFGVTMKAATKENEEWNKAVEEAATAEDYFNLALQECNSQQERQQLITQTLTRLYKDAGEQYRKTNKEVIRANEAAEDWNRAIADIGAEMEPVVTDIKEMGIAMLKQAKEPMKQVADFVRTKLLPMLTKLGNWATGNLPEIANLIGAVAATTVLYKTAVLSAEMATKGLTVATILQQKAQKALNLIMKANPYALAATAIVGLVAAVAALNLATKETKEVVDPLTESERELMAAADEAAEAFREQKAATEEALGNITAEMDHTKSLADELFRMADASGKVAEKDQARAELILGMLNEALGTEYSMVGGVIQQYNDLKTSIEEVMKSKTANALLEAANTDYVTAIQNEAAAWENAQLKLKDYEAQQQVANDAQAEAAAAWEWYNTVVQECGLEAGQTIWTTAMKLQKAADEEVAALGEKESAYLESLGVYENYHDTIVNYESAQSAALQGNYQTTVDLLKKKGEGYNSFSGTVDTETASVLATLQKEAVDAGLKAKLTRENFERGVDGYTEDMVAEADAGYQEALEAFATAYADAHSVGGDLSSGLEAGMESGRLPLLQKARSLVSGIIKAMRKEAESNSPAKKTIEFGEDLGAGAEIGLDNSTPDVQKAATRQAGAVLEAYRSQEIDAQRTLRNIADQQATHVAAGQMAAAATNGPVLEKILAAVEKGQVLMLDGDALVGATANRMDNALGRRRDLAAKGAI